MNVTLITAEYNPLHNGHVYHIKKTKEAFPDSYVVVVMSGDFVMRGETAILSKYERATHALYAGADAVVELPAFASFLHGEGFAESSMKIARLIGANNVSFGSEHGNVESLISLAEFLENPSDDYLKAFKSKLKEGKSYPRAVCESLLMIGCKDWSEILSYANNNLALMDLKALKGTHITPYTVKRTDNGYDNTIALGQYLSASGIRALIDDCKLDEVIKYVPPYVYEDLKKCDSRHSDKFSSLVLYRLTCMTKDEIKNLYDVGEGLENRFKKYLPVCSNIEQLLHKVKCKRYTLSRLKRICAYALFNITKDKVDALAHSDYARMIACKKERTDLISRLKSNGVATCYGDVKEKDRWIWELENVISDTRALITGKTENARNTLFI